MKHTLTVLVFLLAIDLVGQSWFPDGAEWHYGYGNSGWTIGYVRSVVEGDTVVLGQTARAVNFTRYTSAIGSSLVYINSLGKKIMYEEDGIVLAYVPQLNVFDTLYDMNAVPGDRWQLAKLPNGFICDPESYFEVTDTGTTSLYGPNLRWLAVNVHYLGVWPYGVVQDTIIERIGSLLLYILPHSFCDGLVDGAEGGSPLCYYDQEVDYRYNMDIPCDRSLGITIDPFPENLRLWPGPGTDDLHISLDGALGHPFQLVNVEGRVVRQGKLTSFPFIVNTSTLNSGLYIFRAMNQQGQWISRRWVRP